MKVDFIPTAFIDPRKFNSELEIGEVFSGMINKEKTMVYYTDNAETEWVFYVNETCQLLPLTYVIRDPETHKAIEITDINESIEIARDYIATGESCGFWQDILNQLIFIKNSLN